MKNFINNFSKIKIILVIFVIVNFFLYIIKGYSAAMCQVNLLILGYGALSDEKAAILLSLCFLVCEVILIISLFIKKSTYKLIANIIFEVLCVADICICISSINMEWHFFDSLIEIALDLVFIFLILFDIYKTYKKPIKQSSDDVS